jgi:N-acetylmuramoyl-L-alanine amidase
MIVTAASRYGVDPSLALAVAYRESGFHQHRVSAANAIGVMQIVPSAGAWASTVVGRRLDLLDVEDNITAGVVLLSCLMAIAPEALAVAGYYQGLSSVRRAGLLPDTQRYVTAVQTLRSRFR